MRYVYLLILLYTTASFSQNEVSKSITISNKYGNIEFAVNCKNNAEAITFQSFIPGFLDEKINEESESKNITDDRMTIRVFINENGEIYKYEIVNNPQLNSFKNFIVEYFEDIIRNKSSNGNSGIVCNKKTSALTFPIKISLR